MTKDAINNLFESEEMNNILSHFSKENNLRLCLNKNIVEKYRQFFGKIITLSFIVDILPNELNEIDTDVEKYLSKKLSRILNIKEIYNHKKRG